MPGTTSNSEERRLRRDALRVFQAAVRSASPKEAVLRHVRFEDGVLQAGKTRYRLEEIDRVWVVGAGKATAPMAQAIEKLLGKRIAGGAVTVKTGHGAKLKRIALTEASHPVPDSAGVTGALRIAEMVRGAGERDLVIALISGGASALLVIPADPITLAEKQECTRLLLASGASIHEMNAVRKHISAVKGGQLARMAAPARVVALLLSDVIGDDLDVIGSGPAAPDSSTFSDALSILDRRGILRKVAASIRERLERGAAGDLPDTPKPGDALFRRVQNLVVGSNALAVAEASRVAEELGYRPLVLTTSLDGEAREQARMLAAMVREVRASGRPARPPLCLLAGGETVVTLQGDGRGGRNQEFALAAALALDGVRNVAILAAGTDGTDGPTDAAGAIVTGSTIRNARARGIDADGFLRRNDSYSFFSATEELVVTGPTGTNVMDLYAAFVLPEPGGSRR